MKNLFTNSEFAKLWNININSLRYYEKIGVLKPVMQDKQNGYRYYSPEYLCLQVDLAEKVSLVDEIEQVYGKCENEKIIVSNMLLDKHQIGTKKSEFQKWSEFIQSILNKELFSYE